MITKNSISSGVGSTRPGVQVVCAAELEKWPTPFGGVQIMSGLQTLDTVLLAWLGVLFCFDLMVTVPWFFLFEVRKYLIYFDFYRSPQLRDFNFKERF